MMGLIFAHVGYALDILDHLLPPAEQDDEPLWEAQEWLAKWERSACWFNGDISVYAQGASGGALELTADQAEELAMALLRAAKAKRAAVDECSPQAAPPAAEREFVRQPVTPDQGRRMRLAGGNGFVCNECNWAYVHHSGCTLAGGDGVR